MTMLNEWLPYLLLAVFTLTLIGMCRRILLWRAGRPSHVDILGGLLAMPRRYLVDLHHIVARDRYISNTHVSTAGGFVVSMVLVALVYGLGIRSKILVWALLFASLSMFVGAVCVYARRRNPASRLSKGPWMRLPKSLMVFSASFFIASLPLTGILAPSFGGTVLALILLLAIALGLSELLFGMGWGGPMKHAFAGALHLAFHRRPERFGGDRSTGLKPLQLDTETSTGERVVPDTLGVAKPSDFTWNQLLGFDACVQCGRCEAVCPAFAAGQPLNPKKLIQDMVVGFAGGTDADYAGSGYPGRKTGQAQGAPNRPITEGLLSADTLWSCTTCRACVEECPMMIEHVDAIVDMRRYLTLERGHTPNKGAETLDNLIATDNPGGIDPKNRTHWAADQNLPLMADVLDVDVLFWVSDGAFDMRSQRILRAFVKLMKAAQVDFAVLGDEELDCGDVARRLGDEATFQQLAKANIATLNRYRFKRIVTTDPHAFHCLKNEYRDFGGVFDVLHHSTFINQLLKDGNITLDRYKGGRVTYHDPCYLGRYNGEYESPRALLAALGIELVEMQRSGFRSRCCGGGGGAPITDIPGERRIADMRMEDANEVGAEVVAVACQQCTAMLEGVVEPRPQVKDIAELAADALAVEAL